MEDITKLKSQVVLEEEEEEENDVISSQQTLHHNSSNLFQHEDDEYIPYTFNLDPFSPFSSSFFLPSSSSPHNSSESPDSTVYPNCLYPYDDDEYDQMDFITDLFDSPQQIQHHDINHNDEDVDDFVSNNIHELGLRVTGIESDSDTEQLAQQVNDDTERDGLSSVIDRIEEISVSSDISSHGDVTVGVLEWEILLAVNTLERDLELETDGENGFVYTPEFDTLIGQFVETVRALRGTPPAAKSIVDNLPLVVLNKGDDNVICAVCKDEILIEEKVIQLPCRHHYHGDCIKPWLSIRNTCPVCRFELPTDDVDYERSKNRVDDDDLRVGYNF